MPKREETLQYELTKATSKRQLYFNEIEALYRLALQIDDPAVKAAFISGYRLHQERWDKFQKAVDLENDLKFKISSDHSADYSPLIRAEVFRNKIMEAHYQIDSSAHQIKPSDNIKLPKIPLPEFTGERSEWPLFFEKFNLLIHSNHNLDNLTKLHYLLSALKGKAREVCAGFIPSADNYPVLIDALKLKFESKRLLAANYVRQMLDSKPLTEESPSALASLLTRFDTAYKSLKGLNLDSLLDYIVGNILLAKVDPQTRRQFETSQHKEIPTYPDIFQFLYHHAEALTQIPQRNQSTKKSYYNNEFSNFKSNAPKTFLTKVNSGKVALAEPTTDTSPQCSTCTERHHTFKCPVFHRFSPAERIQVTKNKNLCENCLSAFHSVKYCKSKSVCKVCEKPHHSLLHVNDHLSSDQHVTANSDIKSPAPETEEVPPCNFFSQSSARFIKPENLTLLPTAVVVVETSLGDQKARFLVDSGSQSHFITVECCTRFKLPMCPKHIPLEGMGNSPLQAVGQSDLVIKSMHDPDFKLKITALVTKTITHLLPQKLVDTQALQFLHQLRLADNNFHRPGPIDGILGAQVFSKILTGGTLSDPQSTVQAIQTRLGFIILGESPVEVKTNSESNVSQPRFNFCIFNNRELTSVVQQFWALEQVPKNRHLTNEEILCEKIFKTSTTRLAEGRYCVSLPFREFPPQLGDSRATAEKRFVSLERKFSKYPELRAKYSLVMKDYREQGHLSLVSAEEHKGNYIPHFPVFRESSSTPLRIVFDASAKTSNSRSLNDTLFSGPKLQKDIAEILTLFRVSPIVLFADIRQMYRNIAVKTEHRKFQRILWRESRHQNFQTYELNCVIFGLTSAPYLALRTIQQLAEDEKDSYPLAAKLVTKHMYVDDLVVSLESVQEAIEAYIQLIKLFRAGGFQLTKWASNSPEVLNVIPSTEKRSTTPEFQDSTQVPQVMKVLGLKWDPISDMFSFFINPVPSIFTKRGVLSIVARIWDPLGFLAPVTLYAKLLIKELWSNGIDWDDPLPLRFHLRWQQFLEELPLLQNFQIQRYFHSPLTTPVALIGFADSSEKGYGAVVYLRTLSQDVVINLLCAKSRVAPQKTISLPRLELCAAVLLAQLMEFCLSVLAPHVQIAARFAFTDSTVTLGWIKNRDVKRDTFVSHRLSAIENTLKPNEWYHVCSSENAADRISRGLSPNQFLHDSTWLQGPTWLKLDAARWPIKNELNKAYPSEAGAPAVNVLTTTSPSGDPITELITRCSSWSKLCHIMIYILRFGKKLPLKSSLAASDLEKAELYLIKAVQKQHFASDWALISKQRPPSPPLRALQPFLQDGCLRVGGRLTNAPLPLGTRYPLLLPKCHLSNLIIDFYHKVHLHAGPTLLLSLLRQKYWILAARHIIRKRIRLCLHCFRNQPKSDTPLMAPLPSTRVTAVKPFTHCGVDYAGPFSLILNKHRGAKSKKGYICLFVCFTTKAIHLELASELSTHAFLQCFMRFLARRGPVAVMYSDRGTNFVGTKAKLDACHDLVSTPEFQTSVGEALALRRIEWRLNPPSAPHFGGLWEANIKSVKTHLHRVIGSQILSWEEFTTLLTQIESILNSRPLCVLSEDPSEPEALTPAHFLNLAPLQHLPLTEIEPDNFTLRTRKQLLDHMIQSFWKRWKLEYLSSLHSRKRWTSPSKPLAVGTVVLIRDDNAPPLRWPLGVVEAVHPGADGIIRVATVRTKNSVLQRPVVKLFPLPSQ